MSGSCLPYKSSKRKLCRVKNKRTNGQTLQKMLCYIFLIFFYYYILWSDVVDLASEIIRLVFFLSKYDDDFKASFHRSLEYTPDPDILSMPRS